MAGEGEPEEFLNEYMHVSLLPITGMHFQEVLHRD